MSSTTFEVGKTYTGRSICNCDSVYQMTVLRRTAKTITVSVDGGSPKTLRPYLYRAIETVRPNGNYSMALSIAADRFQS